MAGSITNIVSPLDRATIAHLPDGSRQIRYAEPDLNAQQRAEHRKAHEQIERARAAKQVHDQLIVDRVQDYLNGIPDAGAPRDRLIQHTRLLADAKRHALVAGDRVAEIAAAVSHRNAAQQQLQNIEDRLREDYSAYIKFGSIGPRPDEQHSERERLHAVIDRLKISASYLDAAETEKDVAQAVVAKLNEMLSDLRCLVISQSCNQAVSDRIERLVLELRDAYSIACACASTTGIGKHAISLKLPSLDRQFDFAVDDADNKEYGQHFHAALQRLETDPSAEVSLPKSPFVCDDGNAVAPPRRRLFSRRS